MEKLVNPGMLAKATMYRVLRVSDQNLISECCGEYVYLSYQILITFRYTLVLLISSVSNDLNNHSIQMPTQKQRDFTPALPLTDPG
jgi:hypothetical protein